MTQKSLDNKGRAAVFAGSFNPFTIGHYDIVCRALGVFDRIYVCVGINAAKKVDAGEVERRVETIRKVFADEPRVEVEGYDGLTSDYAKAKGAQVLLRGVRSVKDFEYERDMADANKQVFGLETVLMYASPSLAWVSSSMVRELISYGCDVSGMLPEVKQ